MQEIARLRDTPPRDNGRAINRCDLTGVIASDSVRQHNGNIFNGRSLNLPDSLVDSAEGSEAHAINTQWQSDSQTITLQQQRDLALLRASFKGHVIRIGHLLDLHADIDYRDERGLTALHYAIFGGQEAAVQLLLDRGADLNAKSLIAATPQSLAGLKGRFNIAELLVSEYRAAVDAIDPDFGTPLHCAAFAGDKGIARVILDHGAHSWSQA